MLLRLARVGQVYGFKRDSFAERSGRDDLTSIGRSCEAGFRSFAEQDTKIISVFDSHIFEHYSWR
jgi:hypothetical protein